MAQRDPHPRFNARWYKKKYPDVAESGMKPLDHYRVYGKAEGRLPGPDVESSVGRASGRLQMLYLAIRSAVRSAGGIRPLIGKAMAVARREGWFDPGFDEKFYLEHYPDIAQAGVDPYRHYIERGRAEGRMGSMPRLPTLQGSVQRDPSRETVLVVSHEASRTGAPILSANLAQRLGEKYNVVSLLLGDGPLVEAFVDAGILVVGPMPVLGKHPAARIAVEQLAKLHSFKFAVVNSIESSSVLETLAKQFIPSVCLIHEFASYTRPRNVFRDAFLWATETVFSTNLTYQDALAECPELADTSSSIVPQGRCSLFAETTDAGTVVSENARVRATLRPVGTREDMVVVLGVGSVHIRKGVDLFLDCASKVLQRTTPGRCRFVWIGRGYDPERDMAYSVYLADQIRRAGLGKQVVLMQETSSIEEVYKIADVLLVSSRLDPLPNVAIDAMAHGLPVVCFEKTTGVADILAANGLAKECVADYLDTNGMAERVLAFIDSAELRKQTGEALQRVALETFDMDRYVAKIESLALSACETVARERANADDLLQSSLLRQDFLLPANAQPGTPDDTVRWRYLRAWSSGIGRRKPFPGFHPGIYREARGADSSTGDPFANYLRDGQPDGPWRDEVISSSDCVSALPPGLRIALHLHVYYPGLLPEILAALEGNRVRPELFVSVPDANAEHETLRALKAFAGKVIAVRVVPNRGRDIGPFLTAFARDFVDRYDIVGHVHTKKTADVHEQKMGEDWRAFLYQNLLGGKAAMADIILGRMAADASIGLVFPDDPHVVGWGLNRPYAEVLGRELGIGKLPENLVFPVGTMFWARVAALRPLFGLGLGWEDYPAEPLPYDGSKLHALERLLPLVAASQGFRSVMTNVAGVTR